MKKLLLCMTMAAATLAGLCEGASKELDELNAKIEEMLKSAPTGPHGGKLLSPELKEMMDRRSGGLVTPKTNGRTFLLVDARGADDGFLDVFMPTMKRQFHLAATPLAKPLPDGADLFDFARSCKTKNSPAVVLIVDVKDKPTLSAYPEDAVGIVNAASLKTDDASLFVERLSKETWRGIALALGGFSTAAPNGKIVKSILSPVYGVKDLDALKVSVLSPNQCSAVYESVSSIGLQAAKPALYTVACRQGWAPAPTNDIQKAIWDKVHAVPATPMKIEFDPKKGR